MPLVLSISGDKGVRALLRAYPDLVDTVPAPDARMAIDVDTMAQYDEACQVQDQALGTTAKCDLLAR